MARRVGVNLLWLVPGVVGGSEECTIRTMLALADVLPMDVDVRLFGSAELVNAHPELVDRFPVCVAPANRFGKVGRVALENSWLGEQVKGLDLVHHAGGTIPERATAPSLVEIRDLQPLDHPGNFSGVKGSYLARAVPRSIESSVGVITPSEFVRSGVLERSSRREHEVRVVPHGFTGPDIGVGLDDPISTSASQPYVIYPAIAHPHKNHDVLLDMIALGDPEVDLVLTGAPGAESDRLASRIVELGIGDRVRVLGRVPAEHLHRLIASAVALVFPSTYEGFGAPVLEAMALGCPVVAANATALPEVVGSAGILVAPHDPRAWADAVTSVLSTTTVRRDLVARGLARAQTYTAEQSAVCLLGAYEAAFGAAA